MHCVWKNELSQWPLKQNQILHEKYHRGTPPYMPGNQVQSSIVLLVTTLANNVSYRSLSIFSRSLFHMIEGERKKKEKEKERKRKEQTKTICVYIYIHIHIYWRLGGWVLCETANREIVSFRSCVRAGEARRSCVGEREGCHFCRTKCYENCNVKAYQKLFICLPKTSLTPSKCVPNKLQKQHVKHNLQKPSKNQSKMFQKPSSKFRKPPPGRPFVHPRLSN